MPPHTHRPSPASTPLRVQFNDWECCQGNKQADGERDEGVGRVELWTLGTSWRHTKTATLSLLLSFHQSSRHSSTNHKRLSISLFSSSFLSPPALYSSVHTIFYQSCVLLYILPILTSSDFCFPLLCYRQGSLFFSLKCFYWTSSIKTYWSSIWRKYWIHVLIYRARRTILFPSFYNLNLRLSIHQGALKIRYQISGNVRIDFKAKLH